MELLERTTHLEALDGWLREAAGGDGRLVFVGGEAGVGKSALAARFCLLARGRARVLRGGCDALSTPRPLGPLLDLAAAAGGALDRLLAAGAPRDRVFRAVLAELGGGLVPTLAVVEDAHWADEATLDLLRFLGRRLEGARAMVLVTYRDDEAGPGHPLRFALGDLATTPTIRRLTLAPLSAAGIGALAAASPGGGRIDAAALHRLTGGNPFFAGEVLADGPAAGGVPATVRDAVLARASRLPPAGRAALDAAAVIGPAIGAELLAAVAGAAAEGVEACLAGGMLAADGGRGVAFRHELARAAVYGAIPPPRREGLHARVLAALEAGAAAGRDPARLAHHAEAAGDGAAVLRFAPEAARRAAALHAHRGAAAQYARALRFADDRPAPERADLLEALAYQCYLTDRHAESVDAWMQALAIWRHAGNRLKEGEILRWLSRPLWYLGRSPDAEEAAYAALRVLEQMPPGSELGWTYSDLSRLQVNAQQYGSAIAWGEKALALAARLGDAGLLAHALNNVGCAKLNRGDPRGDDDLERSMEVARAADLEEHVGRAYANLASMAIGEFQFARAERWLEEGIAYTLDHDVETYRLCLSSWRPVQLFFQGRWSEAAEAAATLLSWPDLSPLNGLQALVALGRVRARRGDPEAGAALDMALAAAGPTVDPSRRGPVRAARAEAAWLAGDQARAAVEAQAAYGLAIDLNDRWLIGELAFWLWRTGRLAPPPPQAAEPFALQIAGDWAGAAACWQALGCPYEAARALADSGDEGMLRRALAEFVRLGARPMAAIVVDQLRGLGARGIPRGPRPATRANPANLTARELEILPLLACSRRDAEIADRLFLSAKTVSHHVGSILLKLGVHARGDVADAARRLGISLSSDQDRASDPPI